MLNILPVAESDISMGDSTGGVILPSMAVAGLADSPDAFQKAARLDRETMALTRSMQPGSDPLAKALSPPPSAFSFGTMSYMPDPQNGGLLPWPGIPPESLQKIARENLAPEMIVATRIADVLRYSHQSSHPWKPGWRIELRESDKTPSTWDRRDIRLCESMVANCNVELGGYQARERDAAQFPSFQKFLATMTRDFLTYDAMAIYTDLDGRGRVKGWAPMPAGNIRLADAKRGYLGNPKWFAVLVDQTGTVQQPFTRDDLIWHVGNPRVEPDVGDYPLSRLDVGMRLVQGFQNAFDLNSDIFTKCYSEDTEVLTKSGWKTFDKVDIAVDLFATIDPKTREFCWQTATDHTWAPYAGEMYRLKTKILDFLVTPNHRILYEYRGGPPKHHKQELLIGLAKDLYIKQESMAIKSWDNYAIPLQSHWVGVEIESQNFEIGNQPGVTRSISGDDYCAFLGMYLSEGNLRKGGTSDKKNNIVIHQRAYSKGYAPFNALLEKICGRAIPHQKNYWSIGWHGFAEHLAQYGTRCYDKFIPDCIMNATPRQQKIFWDYFVLGDGCVCSIKTRNSKVAHDTTHITTTSAKLADQMLEILQKMGVSGRKHTVDSTKYTAILNGREVTGTGPRYDVYLAKAQSNAFHLRKEEYRGHIGCVSVPNGTLYVRRRGKPIWSGNSSTPMGMLLLKGAGFTQNELDVISRHFQNLKKGISKVWALPAMVVPQNSEVEFLNLSASNNQDLRYQNYMNLIMGVFCLIYQFPHRRMGFHISGGMKDSEPLLDKNAAAAPTDEEDIGLISLLGHLEFVLNQYLIWTRFPHLQLVFSGKAPREDAREYEARQLARTWGERRAAADLPKLEDLVEGKDLKKLAKVMAMAPADPSLSGSFQNLASKMLGLEAPGAGAGASSGGSKNPQSMFPASKDPARAEDKGATSGVRRHSPAAASRRGAQKGVAPGA
ncbi:MAG TPA: hypothetical protein VNG91_08720 [Terriglobia bacterium]|nr:hypothetical protein [Terriglobia bacterium]